MNKILAIDDLSVNLDLIRFVLTRNIPDCNVFTAISGKEGIRLAKEVQPNAILLDIVMPEMDGFQVCETLKNDESTKHIPILLISAYMQTTEDRIKGLDIGAEALLAKPFENAELISQLKVLLRINRAEEQLRKKNESLELFIKNQAEEINNNETRFLQISDYAHEFFWEVDSKGKFTYVSAVVENILGLKSEEIIGKKYIFDFYRAVSEKDESKKILFDIFKDKSYYNNIEISCLDSTNRKIWLTISGFPIYDKTSDFIGYRGVTHDITGRRKAEEELKKSLLKIKEDHKKLKRLNAELDVAEEKERRRIAEYLHDGIGQLLSIARISLSSLQKKSLSEDVIKIVLKSMELLNEAIVRSRNLTYDLSPPILYELGLIPAIRWKLNQIESNNKIETTIQSDVSKLEISNDTRILLYRIVSELLTNVTKHAEASSVKVNIYNENQDYCISVHDNGKGFNDADGSTLKNGGGFGLSSIRERLDSLQGQLDIESKINKGAKVTVRIPILNN
ncbi:MAG: response regulator [Bacteroidales bacterium]|nr:response regulator [Bacteroidales bacterium]